MTNKLDYAVLSLYVYTVQDKEEENRPELPEGWDEPLELVKDDFLGFSYGIFRKTGTDEIAIVFTGSNQKLAADFATTNIPAGVGAGSHQLNKAALVYQQAREKYGDNIIFSGHSLGGGVASVMSVWFDKPGITFDQAPFQPSAISPYIVAEATAYLGVHGYFDSDLPKVFLEFNKRQANVVHHYLSGEILQSIRWDINSIQNNFGAGDEEIKINKEGASGIQLHAQQLLVAALLSKDFADATFYSDKFVSFIMNDKFYATDRTNSKEVDFLMKLVVSEQKNLGDGKLTHFANDLQKLGTDLAGLTAAAQDALLAQGIEWYYWQGSDYAGQEFFNQNGDVLQYTTAQGAGLEGAKNKANEYVVKWLYPIAAQNGLFGISGGYAQWSIVMGGTGSTLTAQDGNLSQFFMGSNGNDTLTGGSASDLMFAGAGNDTLNAGAGKDTLVGEAGEAGDDTLNGGTGNDTLVGGAGNDRYEFDGDWGMGTIIDSDGSGSIWIDGVKLGGNSTQIAPNFWRNEEQGLLYVLLGQSSTQMLLIRREGIPGEIAIKGWQAGQLGINLGSEAPEETDGKLYYGDEHAPVENGIYQWRETSRGADGHLIGGELAPNFNDVIYGSAQRDKIYGLGGNDALGGLDGDDEIHGGEGDDYIYSGHNLGAYQASSTHYQ